MSEVTMGTYFCGMLVCLAIYAWLWMLGGRQGYGKFYRRYIGAFWYSSCLNICALILGTWNIYLTLLFATLFGGSSMGYGGDALWWKIIRRTVFAIGMIASGLVFCLTYNLSNCWALFILHAFVGAGSIYLGTRNPLPAPVEESLVCVLLSLVLAAFPFVPLLGR